MNMMFTFNIMKITKLFIGKNKFMDCKFKTFTCPILLCILSDIIFSIYTGIFTHKIISKIRIQYKTTI